MYLRSPSSLFPPLLPSSLPYVCQIITVSHAFIDSFMLSLLYLLCPHLLIHVATSTSAIVITSHTATTLSPNTYPSHLLTCRHQLLKSATITSDSSLPSLFFSFLPSFVTSSSPPSSHPHHLRKRQARPLLISPSLRRDTHLLPTNFSRHVCLPVQVLMT